MVLVQLSGGLESLFCEVSEHTVDIAQPTTLQDLARRLLDAVTDKHKADLFADEQGIVRPGILVLINSVDWELEGGLDAQIAPEDNVTFISTLHGG